MKPRRLRGMMQKSHYWPQVHRAKNDGSALVDISSNNTRMLLLWQAKLGLLQEKMLIKGIDSMDLPRHLGRNRHPTPITRVPQNYRQGFKLLPDGV